MKYPELRHLWWPIIFWYALGLYLWWDWVAVWLAQPQQEGVPDVSRSWGFQFAVMAMFFLPLWSFAYVFLVGITVRVFGWGKAKQRDLDEEHEGEA